MSPKPWTVSWDGDMWVVNCSDGSLGGRFPREGDARVFAEVAGPGPLTIVNRVEVERLRAVAEAAAVMFDLNSDPNPRPKGWLTLAGALDGLDASRRGGDTR